MKEIRRGIVKIRGKNVDVVTMDAENSDLPVLRIEGRLNDRGYVHTITIGAADEPPIGLTQAALQAIVDEAHQKVAEILVAREEARQMMAILA